MEQDYGAKLNLAHFFQPYLIGCRLPDVLIPNSKPSWTDE